MITRLECRIVEYYPEEEFCSYEVLDVEGDPVLVSGGISSNPDWVRSDAGGLHGKAKLDSLYPDGWEISFVGPGFE